MRGVNETQVAIMIGSDSDLAVMKSAVDVLNQMGVKSEVRVLSAHRTPDAAAEYVTSATQRGVKVFIAGAGMAAHLAGAVAANTTRPVIGVPLSGSALNGLDALYATVQMPGGVPVATMAIGKAGAKNAGLLACQILALSDEKLNQKMREYKIAMVDEVAKKDAELQQSGLEAYLSARTKG